MGQEPGLYKEDLMKKQKKKGGAPTLEQYSRDMTALARDGKLVRYIDSKALRNLLESIFIHKEREFQMPSLSSFRRRKGNQK